MSYVAILTLSILASSCATGIAPPDSSALEQVREAVFRFQLESLAKDQPLAAVYFLSVEGESDPTSTLIGRLVASGFPVKPISASERTFDGGVHPIWVDSQTREKGVLDDSDQAILASLGGGDGHATSEIAAAIGLTPRATRTRLARLVGNGHVRAIGTGPQDPRRRYYLAEQAPS